MSRQLRIEYEGVYYQMKFENRVERGGEAKYVISEGRVRVNGQVETRKGTKLFSGNVVEFGNETMRGVM